MKHLFKSTSPPLFAALTLAGIVSSGYIAFDAARPILAYLPPMSVSSFLSALPTPSPRALVAGASSATQQVEQAVSSLRSQLASLSSQVSALQAVQEDLVLGSSTVLGESDEQQETVAVREEFPPAVNLLRNSSFEEDSDGAPRQWQYQYDSTSGNTKTSAEAYRSGSKGLKVVGGGTGNYGVSQPAAKMVERRDYAFSLWVKPVNTDAHSIKLSFWDEVANKEAAAKTFSFSGTKEWSRIVFQISNKQGWNGKKWFPMITVNGLGSGALYMDDAQLEEASSYTPYHFTGGGATQSFVSVLGDGAVEVDAHGNVYPAVNGIGSVGTGDNKFSELKLSKATINKDGDLDIQGSLTINGNTTLKGTVGFTARFNTHLLPDQTNTYDLGSTTYLWRDLYVDGVGYIDGISSRSNANMQITVGTGTLNLSAATARLTGNLIVTGTETKNGVAYTFPGSDGSANTILTTDGAGVLTWTTAGASGITADSLDFAQFDDSLDVDADTSINGDFSLIIRGGAGARQNATSGSNDLQLSAEDAMLLDAGDFTLAASEDTVSAIAINASRGGISLSSSSAGGNGNITLKSAGTLTLDTSINNTNLVVNTGTGRLVATSNNAGITALQFLATNGGIDLSTSGLGGVGELRLRSGGSLKLDTSGNNNNLLIDTGTGDLLTNVGTETLTAQDDAVAAVGLNASRGGIQLSTSAASSNGVLYLKSAGSLVLDTSAKNTNILLQAGTGHIDISNNLNLTAAGYINWWNTVGTDGIGIRDNNGTIEFKNNAGSWAGIASSASGGGWTDDGTTIRLDTGTDRISVGNPVGEAAGFDVANDYSILLRAGFGARQNATSGANDFQAAAEDAMLLDAGDFTLAASEDTVSAIAINASRGGISLSSSSAGGNGNITLKSAGTLTLDTSINNTNLVVNTGTGRLVATSNNAGITALQFLATNGGIDLSTSGLGGVGELRLRSGGSLKLDTSGNNNNLLIDTGTGDLLTNVGTETLTAQDDVIAAVGIRASRGGIQLSSSNAAGNGDVRILSAGTLQLDTSATGSSMLLRAGAGQFSVNAGNGTATALVLAATNGGIDLSTSGLAGNGNLTLRSAGTLTLDTTASDTDINILAGNNTSTSLTMRSDRGGIDLSSSSANGSGDIRIRAAGTLHLDTSASAGLGGANILARTGTGRFDVSAGGTGTNAIVLAATNGGIDVSTSGGAGNGDLRLRAAGTLQIDTSASDTNILVIAGGDSSTTLALRSDRGGIDLSTSAAAGAGNLTLRSAGTLVLDTSASDTDINILAGNNTATSLTMRSDRGGIDLSSSSANGSGDIKIRSAGTLHLDTSASAGLGGANILANTGTGRLVATSGGTGTGSTAAISLLATNGGIDVSTSGAAGNGNLTLRSAGTLVLDTSASDTDINILAGNNTSTSLTLRSDRGGIDISSSAANGSGDIRIRAGGTLRLDTSVNNSNIMLRAGTGRIDVSGNTIVINSGAGTLDLTSNSTINVVSSTNATLFGETGTFLGRAGQITTVYGRMCIRGSDGGTACPAGSDGRLFVQVAGEVSDDPGDVFADVAEYYPASEPVDAGTVVIADASARATVKMSQYAYQKVLGVVSTSPAVMINEGSFEVGGGTRTIDPLKPLVALVGRVPVKVSNANGAIRVGDRLVASSTSGYAMKATKQGMTLGMALEDQDFAEGTTAKVMTFVNISWYFPEVVAELEREYAVSQALGSAPDVTGALVAAVESSETVTVDPSLAQTTTDAATGVVLGSATSNLPSAELAVAIPPTEFPNVSVTGALTVGKELVVRGTSRFEGEVTVLADATFQKGVIIVGNLRVGGNLDVAGAVTTPLVAGSAVSAGDPVSVSGDGTASRASGGRPVVGVAATNAGSGEIVKVAIAGRVGGLSGLSAGSRYFVSATGMLTTDGAGGQAIGVAVSSSELLVQPGVGLPGVVVPPVETVEITSEPAPVVTSTEPSSTTVLGATTVAPSPTLTPTTPIDTSTSTPLGTNTVPAVTEPVVEATAATPMPEAPSPTPAP